MILQITKKQFYSLLEESRRKYPIEACGLIFGEANKEKAIVRKVVYVHNMLESSTKFQVDPEEFVTHLAEAEKEDLQLIGFFHSHPTAPHPSMTDIRYMKLWPENIWLIISTIDYSMGAYQIFNNVLMKVDIKVNN